MSTKSTSYSVFLYALLPLTLAAQSYTASARGVVTDVSQAGVPGAKVTITDVNRNTTRTAVTDSAGRYVVEAARGRDVRAEIFALASQQRWRLLELRQVGTTLEEVFMRVVAGEEEVGP